MANQNFDLIWGQNSPLAPYEFSNADYLEGWNFVGSTPPARVMFDAVQQENDLKAQNLNRRVSSIELNETPYDRKPGMASAIGNIVKVNGKRLVCVKDGITSTGTISLAGKAEGSLVMDGTVYWQLDSLADGFYNAPHQNGIYRGADITEYWDSGYMSANIRAGKFVGIHIGDIITRTINLPAITYTDKAGTTVSQEAQTFTNAQWLVGGLDVFLHCGDTENTTHHVLLIPSTPLQRNVKMNPTNDTDGAYQGSDMWRIHVPNWGDAIKSAFGAGHVLRHREILSNSVDKTAPSGAGNGFNGSSASWTWVDVDVNIPNEQMVYGGRVTGSFCDVGTFPRILPIFVLKNSHTHDYSWFWLRVVASGTYFAQAGGDGTAHAIQATFSGPGGGLLPYFLAY